MALIAFYDQMGDKVLIEETDLDTIERWAAKGYGRTSPPKPRKKAKKRANPEPEVKIEVEVEEAPAKGQRIYKGDG